jgi:hypothetical protein
MGGSHSKKAEAEGIHMECTKQMSEKILFHVCSRQITLDKDIVDRYSDLVCPVNEAYLKNMITILGKRCKDTVLSYKISLDMARELSRYE